jgi:HAD superfamily hydrolase (TIGR01458 family)
MIKGLFFDISGVLLDGADLIANADKALNLVKQKGLPFRLLTNTSRQTCDTLLRRLNDAGLEVTKDTIYTAPLAAKDYIQNQNLRPYCLIHQNLIPEFADLDQNYPNAVVIGDAADDFNYETLNKAFRLCMEGAPLIAIGHNKYFKESGEFLLDAGPFVEAIEYACDIEAVITGKPSRDFFDQVLNSIGLEANEVALIGDDIYGDISGARTAGMASRLVRTGKYRKDDELKISPTASVVSDVLQAVTDLIT